VTSISANTDGPCDAVLCKIDHIALPTKYEYNYQAKSVGWQQIATPTKKCQLLTHLNNYAQTPLGRYAFGILCTQIFLSHSCACKNGSREPNHAPFRGDLSCLWQDFI